MTNITLRVLSAALLSASLFSATAQAATIGQVDASITGLRYRLIDLDLADGITPTLSVSGGELTAVSSLGMIDPYFGGFSFGQDNSESISAPVFGESGILTLSNPTPGTSATLGSVIGTSSSLSTESWNAGLTQTNNSYSYNGTTYDSEGILRNSTTTVNSWDLSGAQGLRAEAGGQSLLTINGKGLLIIEGTAALSSQFDRSALIEAQSGIDVTTGYGYGQGVTSGTINLMLGLDGTGGTLPGNTHYDSFSGSGFNLSAQVNFTEYSATYNMDGSTEEVTGSTNDSKDFMLTFANLSDDPAEVGFGIFVDSTVTQQFQGYSSQTVTELGDPVVVVTPPPVPGIPEPSTYALMGLGLVGMAAAVRRARRSGASA
jgi:hypothetical protein